MCRSRRDQVPTSRLPSSLRRARQSKNRSYSGAGERDKPSPPSTASLQSLFLFFRFFLVQFIARLVPTVSALAQASLLSARSLAQSDAVETFVLAISSHRGFPEKPLETPSAAACHARFQYSLALPFAFDMQRKPQARQTSTRPAFFSSATSNVCKAPVITAVGKVDHVPNDRSNRQNKAPASNDAGAMDRYFNCITAL